MINSLLDTDLYKLTMMQTVLHHFPGAQVEYEFYARRPLEQLHAFTNTIEKRIADLCHLRFQRDELEYLSQFSFFKSDFIDFLRLFQFCEDFIHVEVKKDQLSLHLRGPWLHTILFEVPLLAIISEAHAQTHQTSKSLSYARTRLKEKIAFIQQHTSKGFHFSDFGTRRRFSHQWQGELIENLLHTVPEAFSGTSNVYLAKALGCKAMGTMAHEYLQACQALGPRLALSQRFAFEKWAEEYRGELGIALTDVIGLNAFLQDFDLYFCKLFDGVRHDSGDPFQWGEAILNHYQQHHIDTHTKTLIFSNNLNFELAHSLFEHFNTRIQLAFGIGTHLTHDVDFPAPQIVIKMTRCNGQPVAKITDDPAKAVCIDEEYLRYLKQVFQIKA